MGKITPDLYMLFFLYEERCPWQYTIHLSLACYIELELNQFQKSFRCRPLQTLPSWQETSKQMPVEYLRRWKHFFLFHPRAFKLPQTTDGWSKLGLIKEDRYFFLRLEEVWSDLRECLLCYCNFCFQARSRKICWNTVLFPAETRTVLWITWEKQILCDF